MRIIRFDEIDSTQNYAKKLAEAGKENFAVWAKIQTLGHGRSGRKWLSPKGGLWFSFVLNIGDLIPEEISLITILTGLAVNKVCETAYKCNLKLKWPNDVILNGKKVSGIICEKIQDKIIIGIGINTNVDNLDEFSDIATSFKIETNMELNNEIILKEILKEINTSLEILKHEKYKIIELFRSKMAFINEKKYISLLQGKAVIKGINDNGHLIVEFNGEEKEIFMGEIC